MRKEKKKIEKSGETPKAVTCRFFVEKELSDCINEDIGKGVFVQNEFTRCTNYDNGNSWLDIRVDLEKFIESKTNQEAIELATATASLKCTRVGGISTLPNYNEVKEFSNQLQPSKKI